MHIETKTWPWQGHNLLGTNQAKCMPGVIMYKHLFYFLNKFLSCFKSASLNVSVIDHFVPLFESSQHLP